MLSNPGLSTAQVQALIDAAVPIAPRVLSSTVLDVSVEVTPLYTVPALKNAVITSVVFRQAAVLTGHLAFNISLGYSAGFEFGVVDVSGLEADTNFVIEFAPMTVPAGTPFIFKNGIPAASFDATISDITQGTGSIRVEVIGYLTNA